MGDITYIKYLHRAASVVKESRLITFTPRRMLPLPMKKAFFVDICVRTNASTPHGKTWTLRSG